MENNCTTLLDPLLKPIEGIAPARNLNRLSGLQANCDAVRREFVGKPEVCHKLVVHIIHIRRGVDLEHHLAQFQQLLDQYFSTLIKAYDVRWLLSILDTIVDHANPQQSAIAMLIVSHVNHLNIHYNLTDKKTIDAISRTKNKCSTWGGMISADIWAGDMIHNMMHRVNRVVSQDPLLNAIWCEIKSRAKEETVLIDHLIRRNKFQQRFLQ